MFRQTSKYYLWFKQLITVFNLYNYSIFYLILIFSYPISATYLIQVKFWPIHLAFFEINTFKHTDIQSETVRTMGTCTELYTCDDCLKICHVPAITPLVKTCKTTGFYYMWVLSLIRKHTSYIIYLSDLLNFKLYVFIHSSELLFHFIA